MGWACAVLSAAIVAAVVAVAATAAPPVSAPVYVVESAVDGTTLAARGEDERRAIASITKLMTVLVALDHASARRRRRRAAPGDARRRVDDRSAARRANHRARPRDRRARTERERCGHRARRSRRPRLDAAFRGADEREGACARPTRHPILETRTGSTSRATTRARATSSALLRAALRPALHPGLGDEDDGDDRRPHRSRRPTTSCRGCRCSSAARRGTRTTPAGRRSPPLRAGRATVVAAVLGATTREARNGDLEALLRWGLGQYRPVLVVDTRRTSATADPGWGLAAVPLEAGAVDRPARLGSAPARRARDRAARHWRFPCGVAPLLGEVRVYDGDRLVARAPLVAARSVAEPGLLGKAAVRGGSDDPPSGRLVS